MPVAGARALFTATRPHASTAPRVATAISKCLSHKRRQLDVRAFRTSSPSRSNPTDDPNVTPKASENSPDKPSANDAPSNEKRDENAQPTATDPSTQSLPLNQKETTPRSQGYGSFRSRALRGKTVEEFPPVNIPAWFTQRHVLLDDDLFRHRRVPQLPEEQAEAMFDHFAEVLDTEMASLLTIDEQLHEPGLSDRLEKKLSKICLLRDLAYWYILSIVHHTNAKSETLAELQKLFKEMEPTPEIWANSPPWADSLDLKKSLSRQKVTPGSSWLRSVRPDVVRDEPGLWGIALPDKETELTAYLELLSRARHELAAALPRQKASGEPYRPVTVLSVLNYKGKRVARDVVRSIASELKSDLLELDAASIGLIVGTYLGQTPYWSKGAMSTLAYAAAEMNGRLAAVAEPADDSEGTISFNIPMMNRLRSFPKKDLQVLLGSSDERWEELKMNHALEALMNMIDAKRASSKSCSASASRPVLVHISGYVELNALAPEVIQKLRAMVDKLWQKGTRIVIIGSSSSDINNVSQWRAQLMEEISKEDCHIVPYHTERKGTAVQEKAENMLENLYNIKIMLSTLEGHSAEAALTLYEDKYLKLFPASSLGDGAPLTLSTSVFGVQTVYRLASLLLDNAKSRNTTVGRHELESALKFLDSRDGNWTQQYPGVPPLHPRGPGTNDNPQANSGKAEDMPSGTPKGTQQYNAQEKKLLTGLINVEDIHTTFDDIVAPEPTKESIKALTSLSLIRPEAYTYGILKTERIPGLLLYGPPGTGKTLLAKAVAKESGASMLEVSAASIMDMYVGNSEKNVQALFSIARKLSPTIIFLDEGDALLGARTGGWSRSAHREVITQFLREWDGLTNTNKHAFIIVATNRPFDLDEAVLRRLPRKMLIDLPLKEEREAILRILLKEETLDEATVSLPALAAETDLYSGSDLKNLCVAAAMEAVKQEMRDYTAAGSPKEGYVWPEKRILTRKHFDSAVKEIGASINEDMESLKAIRKFDERYGDAGSKQRRRKRSMGFEVVPATSGTEAARVRTVLAPAAV